MLAGTSVQVSNPACCSDVGENGSTAVIVSRAMSRKMAIDGVLPQV